MNFKLVSIVSGVAVALLSCALVVSDVVNASSQSTFKMEIVAPECTLDTVDDGSGPVLVITCPPGTVSPPVDDLTDTESKPTTSNDIIASRRIQSPADAIAMFEVLEGSGMVVELPEGFTPSFQTNDVSAVAKANLRQNADQGVFVMVTLATLAVAGLAIGVSTPLFSSGGLEVIRRVWSRWFR